jgi:hypothetical protein
MIKAMLSPEMKLESQGLSKIKRVKQPTREVIL